MKKEKILNIYLIIEKNKVVGFAAKEYYYEGSDQNKIEFLKERAKYDFEESDEFGAPVNKLGKFMSYRKFHKLEKRGMHFQLFEEIFSHYQLKDSPLVCVTPVLDGKVLAQ